MDKYFKLGGLVISSVKSYELFLIFSSRISEEVRNSFVERVLEVINKRGNVSETNKIGKKRLAYPVKKELDGFFVVVKFESDGTVPSELIRLSNVTDGILRSSVMSV